MYEFAAYLGIMKEVKNEKRIRGGSHATRNRRRHHRNKSVSRKSKMTRRKGSGKGKARAMSMLKSAKQRFYGGDQQMLPTAAGGEYGYTNPHVAPLL
jgi:hypothetical protein